MVSSLWVLMLRFRALSPISLSSRLALHLLLSVYVRYELPSVDESQSQGLSLTRGTQDGMPSPPIRGTVGMAEATASSILRVDT